MAITADVSLMAEGVSRFDPDWLDFFSIQPADIDDAAPDRSFERKLETSYDRFIQKTSSETITKARKKEKSRKSYEALRDGVIRERAYKRSIQGITEPA